MQLILRALHVLLLLIVLTSLLSSGRGKAAGAPPDKADPSYKQEYLQVRDANLSATICQQHIHAHAKEEAHHIAPRDGGSFCMYLHAAIRAFRSLGFRTVEVYECAHGAGHGHGHGGGHNRTRPLLCSDISYVTRADRRAHETESDVFLMIGNSFVPSLHVSTHGAHGSHSGAGSHGFPLTGGGGPAAPSYVAASKRRALLYLHTGASHHMQQLAASKEPVSVREQHAAVRNLGAYDQVVFVSAPDRATYFRLMNPLFSTSSAVSSHSGHPTLASVPPRLVLLDSLAKANTSTTAGSSSSAALEEELQRVVIGAVLESPFLSFVRTRLTYLRATVPLDHPRASHFDAQFGNPPIKPKTGAFVGGGGGGGVRDALVAVIIEPRVEGSFEFCVRNVLSHLGEGWGLQVHHSKENEAFVRHVLHDVFADRIRFVALPEPFAGAGDYNQYLKSSAFWKAQQAAGAEHVLLFQSDSLMLDSPHKIAQFLKFSYVGAPWHVSNHASSEWLRRMQKRSPPVLASGVGNGGFSLRNVSAMLRIAEQHRSKNPSINEDVFFLMYLPDLPGAVLPTRQQAYTFAREVPCDDLEHNTDPLGVHAAWAYASRSEATALLEKALPQH